MGEQFLFWLRDGWWRLLKWVRWRRWRTRRRERTSSRNPSFATWWNIKILCESDVWFVDGTFKTSTRIFVQMLWDSDVVWVVQNPYQYRSPTLCFQKRINSCTWKHSRQWRIQSKVIVSTHARRSKSWWTSRLAQLGSFPWNTHCRMLLSSRENRVPTSAAPWLVSTIQRPRWSNLERFHAQSYLSGARTAVDDEPRVFNDLCSTSSPALLPLYDNFKVNYYQSISWIKTHERGQPCLTFLGQFFLSLRFLLFLLRTCYFCGFFKQSVEEICLVSFLLIFRGVCHF